MNNMEKYLKSHPILQQMQPSPEQQDPIFSRGQDLVVTAGAGTGKTRTLVARYLSLLSEGIPLRSIVAITFTKKAAREMRNRIREEVRLFLERSELSDQDRSFWREIYQALDAARISTIHGLAADILRHHPAEMKLDPVFELLEEGDMARLKSQAVETVLAWAANDSEAASLFITFGDWHLRRILNELLAKSLDVREAIDQMPSDLWDLWQPHLVQPIKDFVEHPLVESGLDGFISLDDQGLVDQAERGGDALVPDLRIVIECWKKISIAHQNDDWVEISRHLGPLRNHLKQKGRKENWAPSNPKAVIKEIQNVYDSVLGSNNLNLGVDQNLAQQAIPALMAVYQQADLLYSETKSRMRVLDFDDLEGKSFHLLNEFPEVRKYWQAQINALLVDEFQDTNNRQRELIFLLNGKNKNLFIVGDGKQSIYRFRGADVAVFRDELSRIDQTGRSFQLETSYRSHPGLLQNLNSILEPVLGDDHSLSYVEPFSSLKSGREKASTGIERPFIELHLAAGSKSAGALYLAGEALAYRLKELIETGNIWLEDSSSIGPRLLSYGDVAVLCRASGSFPAYEAAFERAGIPYQTIAGQGFYDRPEIRDVLNALLALSEPENDLALAGLLRSPAGGLSDAALLKLRDFQKIEKLPTLLEAARLAREADLGDEVGSALQTVSLVDELSPYLGRISVAEIMGSFLELTAYIPALTKFGLHRSVQNLKKFIAEVQRSGETNIASFLNSITELRAVAVREGEAQAVAEGAVQIMTVHQAKGLEYPVVVLGDISKRDRFGRDILIDERFGLVLPYSEEHIQLEKSGIPEITKYSSLAYDLAQVEERLKEQAESNRLLYVAATRAQEILIISGVLGKPTKNQNMGKQSGWLGKIAEPLGLAEMEINYEVNGAAIHERELNKEGLISICKIYELGVKFNFQKQPEISHEEQVLVSDYSMLKAIPGDASEKIGEKIDQPIRRVVSRAKRPTAPAYLVGEVVHRALERWIFPDDGEAEFRSWAVANFHELGLSSEKEIKDGCSRTIKNLERFQSSDLYQRMISAERLLHEIPFSFSRENNPPLIGVMDALFVEDGKWILVEFKTDRIQNEHGLTKIWQENDYQEQVAGYLSAAENLLGVRPEPILCFLNYEKRIHLVTDRW